jgi:hypothetical protein
VARAERGALQHVEPAEGLVGTGDGRQVRGARRGAAQGLQVDGEERGPAAARPRDLVGVGRVTGCPVVEAGLRGDPETVHAAEDVGEPVPVQLGIEQAESALDLLVLAGGPGAQPAQRVVVSGCGRRRVQPRPRQPSRRA